MSDDKIFTLFLVVSLAAHTAFLVTLPSLNLVPDKNMLQRIEVTYQKAPILKKEDNVKTDEIRRIEPIKRISNLNITKNPPPSFNDYFLKPDLKSEAINKPVVYEVKSIAFKPKRVVLSQDSISQKDNLPKNPVYLKYYQAIREKIRRYAYLNYNRAYSGEVYISFLVSSDGNLKDLRISEEKSAPDNYLKEIAVKSIKDASPFPEIPQELDYPELSFNVIIAFELD